MNNPDATTTDLMDVLPGPDFPTGGIVMGKSGIRRAYETGRGRVTVRAKVDIEQTKTGKEQIIVTELPYAVNKARLIERISELARDKRIEGITGIRDESDRDGLRISIDVRRDTSASVILNNLYKETLLQTNFSFNMLAINGGKPQTMSLKDILVAYLTHQREVIRRRTAFDLQKAQARAHILEGLRIALDHIDAIINIIRSSATSEEAKTRLIDGYALSDKQAQAILDMRLVRLTGLERDKIEDEYQKLVALIADLKDILAHQERVDQIIYDELLEIQTKFGDARRTELQVGDVTNLEDEDLIEEEDVIVTLTRNGYIKRVPQAEFKAQNRGGRGVQGMNVNDEDFVDQMLATSTHDTLLFFTNKGKVYRMKGYEVPEYGRQAKGIPVVNLLNFEDDEKIQAVISVRGEASESKDYLFFVTRLGVVKRTAVSEFANIRTNGLKALTLHDGDEVLSVQITNGTQSILIATQAGYSVRFAEDSVRVMGRSAAGVRGIRLRDNDVVIGADVVTSSDNVLVITEKGFGKQTPASEYPIKGRGGKGIKTANITDKNGVLAGMTIIHGHEDIMVTTTQGVMIRFAADSVSQTGRATLGVRLIRLEEGTKVATLTKVDQEDLPDEIATDVTDDTVLNNEQLSQVSELLSRAARDDEDSES